MSGAAARTSGLRNIRGVVNRGKVIKMFIENSEQSKKINRYVKIREVILCIPDDCREYLEEMLIGESIVIIRKVR